MKTTLKACAGIHRPGVFEWGENSGKIKDLNMAQERLESAVLTGNTNKTKSAADFYWVTYKTLLLDFIDWTHGYKPQSEEKDQKQDRYPT